MPLDNSFNQDLHESVCQHTSLSLIVQKLVMADNQLFLMATPKETSSAYLHVFHPLTGVSPTSKQIMQDVMKVRDALNSINKGKGVCIPGLAGGCTAGKHHTTRTNKNHGGRREYLEYNPILCNGKMHHDLQTALQYHGGNIV